MTTMHPRRWTGLPLGESLPKLRWVRVTLKLDTYAIENPDYPVITPMSAFHPKRTFVVQREASAAQLDRRTGGCMGASAEAEKY